MPTPFDHTPPTTSGRDEFWGDQAGWSESADRRRPPRVSSGTTARRWWDSLIGGGTTARRTHGVSAGRTQDVSPRPSDGELPAQPFDHDAATSGDDQEVESDAGWDSGWDVEPTAPRRPGVDPLLARFGLMAIVVTLSVPVVIGFTSGDDTDQLRDVATAATVAEATTVVESTTGAPAPTTFSSTAPSGTSAPVSTVATAAAPATVAAPSDSTAATPAAAAVAVAQSPCGAEYELAAGDYWIRIADAAEVRLADLLAVNDATIDTVLVPGRSICLPAGARTPTPPPAPTAATTPPSTTSSPSTTSRPAPTTPATAPPTTAPATTKPPPAPATPGTVEAIIRSVWPDELENRALEIAWRESNYQPTAQNYCCYGLFQIYWSVHQSWLRGIGITSAEQLFDPTTNARAAYALYQRSGGFGPWGG